jgi:hypothetical protein
VNPSYFASFLSINPEAKRPGFKIGCFDGTSSFVDFHPLPKKTPARQRKKYFQKTLYWFVVRFNAVLSVFA